MNYIHELVEASNFGFCTENTTFKTEKFRIFFSTIFFYVFIFQTNFTFTAYKQWNIFFDGAFPSMTTSITLSHLDCNP